MNEKETKQISKFLSLVLRHAPETIQLSLDENGWASVSELIAQCNKHQRALDIHILDHVVETNDKKRFAFNDAKTKIRASQGHSVSIDLALQTEVPPEYLYHGTVSKFIEAIKKEGLRKMSRQHVHLSHERDTAAKVGSRRGAAIILTVRSGDMQRAGIHFFLSENGVWLTDEVAPTYIQF